MEEERKKSTLPLKEGEVIQPSSLRGSRHSQLRGAGAAWLLWGAAWGHSAVWDMHKVRGDNQWSPLCSTFITLSTNSPEPTAWLKHIQWRRNSIVPPGSPEPSVLFLYSEKSPSNCFHPQAEQTSHMRTNQRTMRQPDSSDRRAQVTALRPRINTPHPSGKTRAVSCSSLSSAPASILISFSEHAFECLFVPHKNKDKEKRRKKPT